MAITREDVERIRSAMTTRLPNGQGIIVRTHKNAQAYDLLQFIDENLPMPSAPIDTRPSEVIVREMRNEWER